MTPRVQCGSCDCESARCPKLKKDLCIEFIDSTGLNYIMFAHNKCCFDELES